jgi:Plavaka transposase
VTTKKLTTPFIHERSEIQKFGVKDPYHDGQDHAGLFENVNAFFRPLLTLTATLAEWKEMEVTDPKGAYKCKGYRRDVLAVLQEILDNPCISDKVVWAPRRMYDEAGNRVYTDLHTANWWWETQVSTIIYHLVLNVGEGRTSNWWEQHDNSDHLNVRQDLTRGLFGQCDGVASIHDDW